MPDWKIIFSKPDDNADMIPAAEIHTSTDQDCLPMDIIQAVLKEQEARDMLVQVYGEPVYSAAPMGSGVLNRNEIETQVRSSSTDEIIGSIKVERQLSSSGQNHD